MVGELGESLPLVASLVEPVFSPGYNLLVNTYMGLPIDE